MQVKKFEAPTMQEALDTIKRELGPEAIILQTKQNKGGFGILSKGSVEVTAAITDRAIQKKRKVEGRIPESSREAVRKLPAGRQAEIYEKYSQRSDAQKTPKGGNRHAAELYGNAPDHLETAMRAQNTAPDQVRITGRRYSDIDAHEVPVPPESPTYETSSGDRRAATAANMSRPGNSDVEQEMKQIKRMLAEMRATQETQNESGVPTGTHRLAQPALQEAFDELVLHGLDRKLAFQLLKQVSFDLGEERANDTNAVLDQVASNLMDSIKVAPFLETIPKRASGEVGLPRMVAFVGPTGVGKTTSVAKIASQALLQKSLKVGLVNLDNYKVAASDQLRAYAKALNLPFRNATNAQELIDALRDFKQLDLILIDTAGRSQRDPAALTEMKNLLQAGAASQEGAKISSQIVLSVTTRDQELYEIAQRFSLFAPEGLVISKLDEANTFGAIVNVSHRSKLPLVFFATGQRVPEDIEAATPERVVSLLMDL